MKLTDLQQRLNLKTTEIKQICQQWQITELALFGSVLREDFRSDSDIDVLVSFAENAKITFFDLDAIENQLSQLFNRPVDLVTKKAIQKSHNWIRRQNILNDSQVIYEQR
jgi:predicted nucleotidyltransferase